MKYIRVNNAFVIISEDDAVDEKIDLLKYNDPKAIVKVFDSLEEIEI